MLFSGGKMDKLMHKGYAKTKLMSGHCRRRCSVSDFKAQSIARRSTKSDRAEPSQALADRGAYLNLNVTVGEVGQYAGGTETRQCMLG
jgi:hypothetical protein